MLGRKNQKNKGQEPTPEPRSNPVSPTPPPPKAETPAAPPPVRPTEQPTVRSTPRRASTANLGKSITVKGELTGNEDLTVDGTVDGKIVLHDHCLTIGANAHVTGEVSAKTVAVVGHVVGNIIATVRIEVAAGGTVEGDLIAPKVVLADGARFKGSIDMLSGGSPAPTSQTSWEEPEPEPEQEQATTSDAAEAAPLPDDVIDDTPAKPEKKASGKKNKTEKSSEATAKDAEGSPELAGMFDKFDPSNP